MLHERVINNCLSLKQGDLALACRSFVDRSRRDVTGGEQWQFASIDRLAKVDLESEAQMQARC